MNDLKLVEQMSNSTQLSMTLKEITDLLVVRHDNAMRTVATMATDLEFGTILKMDIVYNDKGQTIQTYQLDKRQSFAVAAKLNTSLLMKIIDRWQELEGSGNKAMDKISLARRNLELTIREVELEEEAKALSITLDKEQSWSSIKQQEKLNNTKFAWQPLKKYSIENSIDIKKVFDQNYGEVNSYNEEVWLAVYEVEL